MDYDEIARLQLGLSTTGVAGRSPKRTEFPAAKATIEPDLQLIDFPRSISAQQLDAHLVTIVR
jgi:hypothetical protein